MFASVHPGIHYLSLFLYLNLFFSSPTHSVVGQPSSHSIKRARWLVVTTTSQAACSSPGSATIKAGSPPTRYASMSGTPCRMCSHTVPIHPCSSLMCRYPDHMECFSLLKKNVFLSFSLSLVDTLYFNVMVVLQAYRKRADRATDQNQFEGDHDAERPRECHLQRGESVLQMLRTDAFLIDIFKGCSLSQSVCTKKNNPTF